MLCSKYISIIKIIVNVHHPDISVFPVFRSALDLGAILSKTRSEYGRSAATAREGVEEWEWRGSRKRSKRRK